MSEALQSPDGLVTRYENALASQRWAAVEPLIHPDACVTFSDGTTHRGRDAVRDAFEKNFRAIENERYEVTNIDWVTRTEAFAVYLFEFAWAGSVDGRPASGAGRGTCVLTKDGGEWRLLVEHLGPR
ncbi:MAG: nuclear transport factor 2 family protein [Planctomycetota bacterium]